MPEAVNEIVARFALKPHPEGGFFREVYRSSVSFAHPGVASGDTRRSAGTFIYFLLPAGQFSAFHRVRSGDEIWHLYSGGPLELHLIGADDRYALHTLRADLEDGEPSAVVPAGTWQAARPASGSAWAFCGCTVTPGFDFADFEMPPARALLERHGRHERIIRELTRR